MAYIFMVIGYSRYKFAGLVSALIGDGWLVLVSWACLGSAVFIIPWAYYVGASELKEWLL
ncbi:MAG: hypothetical protein HRU23_13095 [Gammaproteobacteria bacterium]|nr:hypothetical protein [Gammaproteobacteria bacterium]